MATLSLPALSIAQYQPNLVPLDLGKTLNQAELIRGNRTTNATALLQLQQLREAEAARQAELAAYRQHPELLTGQDGGMPQSPLMSLNQPAPGAITQQTMRPADATLGTPATQMTQQVPTYPDLSQFATGQGQPSPLASLNQPQGFDMNALVRQNPQAAMHMIARQQQMQESRLKAQENILKAREQAYATLGQIVQGATDQASWDQARSEVAGFDPRLAAQMPQTYSKEARDRLVTQALSVKDRATLDLNGLNAQAQALNARTNAARLELQRANIPNYTGEANLDAAIYERMKDQPAGTMPSADTVAAARKDVQEGKVRVASETGAGAAQQRALGESGQKQLEAYDKAGFTAQTTHGTLDQVEALLNSEEGVYGNSLTDRGLMLLYEQGQRPNDQKARNTAQLRNLASQLQLAHGSLGAGVSVYDAQVYAQAAGDLQKAQNVEQMKQYIAQMRPVLDRAMTRANEARRTWETEGRLPAFGRGSQPAAGGGGQGTQTSTTSGDKVVSRAALHAEAARRGVSPEQAEAQAKAKGYRIE